MLARSEWSACTRTAFLPHALTTMSPPKFCTTSRAPCGTVNEVSVWAFSVEVARTTAARVMSIEDVLPLGLFARPRRRDGIGGLAEDADLAPHLLRDVTVEI